MTPSPHPQTSPLPEQQAQQSAAASSPSSSNETAISAVQPNATTATQAKSQTESASPDAEATTSADTDPAELGPDGENIEAIIKIACEEANKAVSSGFDKEERQQDIKACAKAVKTDDEALFKAVTRWQSWLLWFLPEIYCLFKACLAQVCVLFEHRHEAKAWNKRLKVAEPIQPETVLVLMIVLCGFLNLCALIPIARNRKARPFTLAIFGTSSAMRLKRMHFFRATKNSLNDMPRQLATYGIRVFDFMRITGEQLTKNTRELQAKYSGRGAESCKTHKIRNGAVLDKLEEAVNQQAKAKLFEDKECPKAQEAIKRVQKVKEAYEASKVPSKPKKPGGRESDNERQVREQINKLELNGVKPRVELAEPMESTASDSPRKPAVSQLAIAVLNATWSPKELPLPSGQEVVQVAMGTTRPEFVKLGQEIRALSRDCKLQHQLVVGRWDFIYDNKTGKATPMPAKDGMGVQLPFAFQGAIPARPVIEQIYDRLCLGVSSRACVDQLRAQGISVSVQAFEKACLMFDKVILKRLRKMIRHCDFKLNEIILVDETPMYIYELAARSGTRGKKVRRLYVICINSGPNEAFPCHQFVVAKSRSYKAMSEALRPYLKGRKLVISDRYPNYAKLSKEYGFELQYCHSHVKLYFYPVIKPYLEQLNELEAKAKEAIVAAKGYADASALTAAELSAVDAQVQHKLLNLPLDIRIMMVCAMINTSLFQIQRLVQNEWLDAMDHSASFAEDGHLSESDIQAVNDKVNALFRADIDYFKDSLKSLLELIQSSDYGDVGTSANYVLNEYDNFFTYLDYPGAPIDNNVSERMMRVIAAIRKAQLVNQSQDSLGFFCDGQTVLQTFLALGFTKQNLIEISMTLWDGLMSHNLTHHIGFVQARDGDFSRVQAGLYNLSMADYADSFPFHRVLAQAIATEMAKAEQQGRKVRAIPKAAFDSWLSIMDFKVAKAEAKYQAKKAAALDKRLNKGKKKVAA